MRRLLRLSGLGALIILIASALGSRTKKTTTAEAQDVEHGPGNELGRFIEVINRVHDESDEEYVASVARLREAKEVVLEEARGLLTDRTEVSFAVRHSTSLAVAALRDGSALELLSEVALNPQPLPPDPPPDIWAQHGHGSQERVQQEMLALDALDGVVSLADDGHAPALEVLFRAATSSSLTVRAVALAALAARPERGDLLERARSAMPPVQRHMGLPRFASVQDVPQVRDPRVHLAQPERDSASAPPLPGDDAHPRPEQRRVPNAPRISTERPNG